MTQHPEKTRQRILGHPAPRDLEWKDFIALWEAEADRVEQESGDRLAVDMNGHREVFRRQHDGLVGIEDVERARHLLRDVETTEGTGKGLYVVVMTEEDARFYDFDLSAHDVETLSHEHEKNPDPRGHHMRTVEKKTGRDDEADLKRFFDDLVADLKKDAPGREFVLLGHGTGKSDAASAFRGWLEKHHADVASLIVAEGTIDIESSTEADVENAAKALAGR